MRGRPDYGIDSPAMVVGELALAGVACGAAAAMLLLGSPHLLGVPLWAPAGALGLYLALMAFGMLHYSLRGKLRLRDRLLRSIQWSGHERVLDIGCGRGLLLVGAAHRLTGGMAIGVDRWIRGAVSGNRPEAALRNAKLEGVADRVAVQDGDARDLPFEDASFDVVLSNFVLHEMDTHEDRERMLREHARVLKPGGQLALVDFIFADQAVRVLRECGVADARREPAGRLASASFALVTFGIGRLCGVRGTKIG
jgi:ubiquinone/menaquinone biosynthesis C-methylase UbiE